MAKRITIKDIARAAGVSPQAVSHALSGADDVSEATRRRVKEIAEKLNYVKNSAASSLRSGGTKMIAVVYDNPLNVYFSFMTAYLHECLKAEGYSIIMMVEPVRRFSSELYLSVVSRNVDGVLSFIEPSEDLGDTIETYGVPVVLVGRRSEVKNVDCIYTDDENGGRAAARYLADGGAKKIACLFEDLDFTCARDRYEGFKSELLSRGLFSEKRVLFLGGRTAKECWESLMRSGEVFDGVFCFSDFLALETVCYFKEREISVPVVGYDDVRERIAIPYSFPSIGSDKRSIAETSAAFLLDRIRGFGGKKRERKFDVYLVERRAGKDG